MNKHLLIISALCLCCCAVMAQTNYLDNYIGASVTLTTIATSSNSISQPRDLDFKPNSNELWVCQYGNSAGGTMDIFYDAGLPTQTNQLRHDDHSDHFFYYPSAIAFGDNGQFANTNEIQNSNASTPTFMGPALWLSDTAIYARVWQNNWANGYPLGSHIDMLHQSPFSMGIAHDSAEAYWVLDGYNGNICKYDYVHDHGPGYDDHSAGKIWRYSDVSFTRVVNVPSHCILDKANGRLYFIDGGPKKIKRMDINSGSFAGNLTTPSTGSEPLAGYYNYTGATVETLDSLITQPCGMDYYNGRLIVSDYTNGNIYLYSTDSAFTLLETIVTGHAGMMGVKVGPDGHIWCVNKTENKVYRLDVTVPVFDVAVLSIDAPVVQDFGPNFYSTAFNVCYGNTITPSITVKNTGSSSILAMDFLYTIDNGTPVAYNWVGSLASGSSTSISLPSSSSISSGSHLLTVQMVDMGGYPDDVDLNNIISGSFRSITPLTSLPFTENFSANVFPPADWNYIHFNPNNYMSRASVGGFGNSTGCMKMDNYSGVMNIAGQEDYLMSPMLDFESALSPELRFNVAYAKYNSSSVDELKIVASTDCGATWTQVYDKKGTTLQTITTNASNAWTPSATQWRTDSVNLSAYAGDYNVILMFTSISDYGNNLYVDDIFVGETPLTGIAGVVPNSSINVYPNPALDIVNITLGKQIQSHDLKISVQNALGRNVSNLNVIQNSSSVSIPVQNLSAGTYFIQIADGESIYTRKFIKN